MVLISSTKYACETCIKGHRSSTCKHTDRALFEIKKKGRPVTQCEHCRELRKTKQVHVKCLCELKDTSTASLAPGKKANSQVPESAAFPFGLAGALEASVALQLLSEGSSDSDHGGPCTCKAGGNCNCWTPRTSVPRSRKKAFRQPNGAQSADLKQMEYNPSKPNPTPINARTPSHILARISELRPVLPRPPMNKEGGLTGPLHVPSSGVAHGRHHHENMFFSPYGRAYDYARGSHEQLPNDHELTQQVLRNDLSEVSLPNEQSYANQLLQIASSWMPTSESVAPFSSLCGCGDGCSCPGCVQHTAGVVSLNNPSNTSFQFCTNPGACASCLNCNIISVPEFLPSDTVLSIHDSESIDEWLRQVSALPTAVPVPPAPISDTPLEVTGYQAPSWNPFQMPGLSEPDRLPVLGRGCCDGLCRCPPGLCRCEYRDNQDEPNRPNLLTSGERMSHCCGKMEVRRDFLQNDPNFTRSANPRPLRVAEGRGVSIHTGGFLTVPQMGRSRSSSVSSQSSAGQISGGNAGPIPNTRVRVATRMSPLSFPITPSSSPIVGEPDGAYAGSNPDSDLSLDDAYSQYDPSLDEIQLS